MKLAETKCSLDTMLLAAIADRLGFLAWAKTEDGLKGRNRPESILKRLTDVKDAENDVMKFDSIEAFEERRLEIIKRGETDG